jgi:hypothetical protein
MKYSTISTSQKCGSKTKGDKMKKKIFNYNGTEYRTERRAPGYGEYQNEIEEKCEWNEGYMYIGSVYTICTGDHYSATDGLNIKRNIENFLDGRTK